DRARPLPPGVVAAVARMRAQVDVRVGTRHVTWRAAVPGPPGFARRQWIPADAGPRAYAPVHARAAVAEEHHQRRRIHRARRHAPGHPGPARAHHRPAAVVEGREAPGRIVDPGPAPGIDP